PRGDAIIDDRRTEQATSWRGCPHPVITSGSRLLQASVPARGLVFDGSFLAAIQGAACQPLAFAVSDVTHGLTATGAAVASRVAGRTHGWLVAAWPIAEGEGKKIFAA